MLDLRDVPLDDGIDVVEVPVLPTRPGGTLKRLGIAAGEHRCDEVVPPITTWPMVGISPRKACLRKSGGVTRRSLRESGSNRTTSMRPASRSVTRGRVIRSAEPVSRSNPKKEDDRVSS